MAITTMDQLVNAMATASQIESWNYPSGTTVAGGLVLLNKLVTGAQGAIPNPTVRASGGEIPTSTTTGACIKFTNPIGSEKTYVAAMSTTAANPGTLYLYDRVYAASNFSGTDVTAQTITGFPTLTRPGSDGTGLEIFIESYSTPGNTPQQVTVQYTNSDNVSGRNTVAEQTLTSFTPGRVQRLRLQAGDKGVKSIQSLTLAGSTGSAGNLGVALYRPLGVVCPNFTANVANTLDFAATGLPEIGSDASLVLIHQGTTTTTGAIMGYIKLVQG